MSNPFLIFSWNAPFLPAFRKLLLKDAERGAIPLVISRSTCARPNAEKTSPHGFCRAS